MRAGFSHANPTGTGILKSRFAYNDPTDVAHTHIDCLSNLSVESNQFSILEYMLLFST